MTSLLTKIIVPSSIISSVCVPSVKEAPSQNADSLTQKCKKIFCGFMRNSRFVLERNLYSLTSKLSVLKSRAVLEIKLILFDLICGSVLASFSSLLRTVIFVMPTVVCIFLELSIYLFSSLTAERRGGLFSALKSVFFVASMAITSVCFSVGIERGRAYQGLCRSPLVMRWNRLLCSGLQGPNVGRSSNFFEGIRAEIRLSEVDYKTICFFLMH